MDSLAFLVLIGSYDCSLSGVYGEMNLSSSASDQELVPLLKQLIAMLDYNAPFVLSSDLITNLNTHQYLQQQQGGDNYNVNMTSTTRATPQGECRGD